MTTGVYAIVNTVSGRAYIGATSRSMRERWNVHRSHLRAGNHENRLLQADWDEHGAEIFAWTALEDVREDESLQHREDYWVQVYRERGIDLYHIRPILAPPRNEALPDPSAQKLAGMRWAKRKEDKVCPFCGQPFKGDARQTYCTPAHQNAAAAKRHRERARRATSGPDGEGAE